MSLINSLKQMSEQDIMSQWEFGSDIVISVFCITYNHERYIAHTINSILAQKTKYRYELIIHDDASEDSTSLILREYQKKYPSIIKLILQTDNQYSKGIVPFEFCQKMANGRYIAICEGDDFWLDELKLEIQASFLEDNKEYIISSHDACIVNENNELIKVSKLADKQKKNYKSEDMVKCKAFLLTLSWMYRNLDFGSIMESRKVLNYDTFFISVLGLHGKAKFHHDIKPAAYRVHSTGVWSPLDKKARLVQLVNTYLWLYIYHNRVKSGFAAYFSMKTILVLTRLHINNNGFLNSIKLFLKFLFKCS